MPAEPNVPPHRKFQVEIRGREPSLQDRSYTPAISANQALLREAI